jgi:hypothetical protein
MCGADISNPNAWAIIAGCSLAVIALLVLAWLDGDGYG